MKKPTTSESARRAGRQAYKNKKRSVERKVELLVLHNSGTSCADLAKIENVSEHRMKAIIREVRMRKRLGWL